MRTIRAAEKLEATDCPPTHLDHGGKDRVQERILALCAGVAQPQHGRGRPRTPLADIVFAAAAKGYSRISGRCASEDTRERDAKGSIARAPHYVTVMRALSDPSLTLILKQLIAESALSLRSEETNLVIGVSEFATCVNSATEMRVRASLACDTKTHVVASADVVVEDDQLCALVELQDPAAEETFSLIKSKFGGSVRSRLSVARVNEVYCKILAHNVSLVCAIDDAGSEPPSEAQTAARSAESSSASAA